MGAGALGVGFYLSLASRVLVYAIAATSLNLVLGYGGMVSFGHAAFVGLGAYVTGVMISEGVLSGAARICWRRVAVTALAAALIGAISLRTRGVYFIMITLAFAQMLFYLANSIKGYGGDEGLNIRARSLIGFGLRPEESDHVLLRRAGRAGGYACGRWRASCRRASAARCWRSATTSVRAEALGFRHLPLRWLVFVVAGMVAGIAGALSVNQQGYVSPNLLHWTQSGTLMVMVILGGVATRLGRRWSAPRRCCCCRKCCPPTPTHWEFWTGWVLLAVVLFARQGLAGLLRGAVRAAMTAPVSPLLDVHGCASASAAWSPATAWTCRCAAARCTR